MQPSDLYIMLETLICQARQVNRAPVRFLLGPDASPLMEDEYKKHVKYSHLATPAPTLSEGCEYNGVPIGQMPVNGIALVTTRVIPVFKITKATPIAPPPDSQP